MAEFYTEIISKSVRYLMKFKEYFFMIIINPYVKNGGKSGK